METPGIEGLILRKETPQDDAEVDKLVRLSFATSSHSDGTEADYLSRLREKPSFLPELSFVVEKDLRQIIGQIVLSETTITTPETKITQLLLSPICVHPDFFRRGVARAMVREITTGALDGIEGTIDTNEGRER